MRNLNLVIYFSLNKNYYTSIPYVIVLLWKCRCYVIAWLHLAGTDALQYIQTFIPFIWIKNFQCIVPVITHSTNVSYVTNLILFYL